MKIKRKFVWTLFLPLLLACGSISSSTTPLSASSFIEGLWVPSKYTLEFMDNAGYEFTTHSIEFFSDGGAILTNIPSAWLFDHETSSMDFYSGNGTWSLAEERVENSVYIYPVVNISSFDGRKASLKFGTVLEYIEFVPISKPKEINWVTFQKCPPHVYITDDFLEPLAKALSQSPRDTLGFSPITAEDRIEMDIDGLIGKTDVWLHAYNDFSSHDIFLKLHDQEYIWVHEQESFGGPATWVDSDASTWQETITLQYQTEEINGGPLNLLTIDYIGPDPRLQNTSKNWYLSNNLNDVLPILEEWRQWRASEPPSPQALCP